MRKFALMLLATSSISYSSVDKSMSVSGGVSLIGLALETQYFIDRNISLDASFEGGGFFSYSYNIYSAGASFFTGDQHSKWFLSTHLVAAETEIREIPEDHDNPSIDTYKGPGVALRIGHTTNIDPEQRYDIWTSAGVSFAGFKDDLEGWQFAGGMPFLRFGISL